MSILPILLTTWGKLYIQLRISNNYKLIHQQENFWGMHQCQIQFNPATCLCLPQTRTWITNNICCGLFFYMYVQVEVGRDFSFCWCWWNRWQKVIKHFFSHKTNSAMLILFFFACFVIYRSLLFHFLAEFLC